MKAKDTLFKAVKPKLYHHLLIILFVSTSNLIWAQIDQICGDKVKEKEQQCMDRFKLEFSAHQKSMLEKISKKMATNNQSCPTTLGDLIEKDQSKQGFFSDFLSSTKLGFETNLETKTSPYKASDYRNIGETKTNNRSTYKVTVDITLFKFKKDKNSPEVFISGFFGLGGESKIVVPREKSYGFSSDDQGTQLANYYAPVGTPASEMNSSDRPNTFETTISRRRELGAGIGIKIPIKEGLSISSSTRLSRYSGNMKTRFSKVTKNLKISAALDPQTNQIVFTSLDENNHPIDYVPNNYVWVDDGSSHVPAQLSGYNLSQNISITMDCKLAGLPLELGVNASINNLNQGFKDIGISPGFSVNIPLGAIKK